MLFGVVTAGWAFCRLSSKILRVSNSLLQALSPDSPGAGWVYIDDFCWLLPRKRAIFLTGCLLILFPLLGITLSWPKCSLMTSCFRFIGFDVTIEGIKSEIQLSAAKVSSLSSELNSVIVCRPNTISLHTIESFAGKLTRLCMICPCAKSNLSPVYSLASLLKRKRLRSVKLSPNSELFSALCWWSRTISSHSSLVPSFPFLLRLPIFPVRTSDVLTITCDASTYALAGWMSFRDSTSWFQVPLSSGEGLGSWRSMLETPSNPTCNDMVLLECLAAALGLCAGLDIFPTSVESRLPCRLFTDNTGAMVSFRKFRSRTFRINKVLQALVSRLSRVCYSWEVFCMFHRMKTLLLINLVVRLVQVV